MPVVRLRSSLITRLAVVSLLVVVLGSLARFFFLTTSLREDLKSLVISERLSIANQVAAAVDYRLKERLALLERVAGAVDPSLISEPRVLEEWLQEHQALLPAFSLGLAVVDARGELVARWSPGAEGAAQAAEWVRSAGSATASALAGRQDIAILPAIGQPALAMASPIRDAAGVTRGAVVGVGTIVGLHPFDVTAVGDGSGADSDHGGLLVISPKDHLFVSSTDPSMVFKPTPPTGVNLLHDRAMAGYRGTGMTVNAQGVEEISAMVSIPTVDWFVVARIPTTEAFAAVNRTKQYLLIGTAITVVFVMCFVVSLFWWALKPLFHAVNQADAMTRGEIALQPLPVVRDDEVGLMTAAFNRLLVKLGNTQQELAQLAYHDSLTGLPNRRLLADRLRQSLARSERVGSYIALMVMDLDGFKQINDNHGHEAGDETLRVIAERFMTALRRNDTLARLGGDEFVLLASDLTGDLEEALVAAQSIAAKCISIAMQPLHIDGKQAFLGVSIGIAMCDGHCDPEKLMDAADHAMYEAKEGGRGRYAVAPWGTRERASSAAAA